jgi:hypothetical protein
MNDGTKRERGPKRVAQHSTQRKHGSGVSTAAPKLINLWPASRRIDELMPWAYAVRV